MMIKSETRRPKSEGNPKLETRNQKLVQPAQMEEKEGLRNTLNVPQEVVLP